MCMKGSSNMEIMNMQMVIQRTTFGWPISENAKNCLRDSLSISDEYAPHVAKCKNCGIVLNQKCFYAGCPNCKAKDIDILSPE